MTITISSCISTILLLLLFLVVSGIVFLKYRFNYWKKKKLYQIPPSLPFGNAGDLILGKCNQGEIFAKWYNHIKSKNLKHGGAYFVSTPVYIPVDPQIIKTIIVSDFAYFPNHGLYMNEKDEPLTAHIFNMEDSRWKNLRAKMTSIFTTSKMRQFHQSMIDCTYEFVKVLSKHAENQETINIKDQLRPFTTDIICAAAFGIQSNCLKNQNQKLQHFSPSFFEDIWSVFNNSLAIVFPKSLLLAFGFRVLPKEPTDFFMNFFRDVKEFKELNRNGRKDLVDYLIRLTNPSDEDDRLFNDVMGKGKKIEPMSFEEFAAQAYVFFEAGFETSSTASTFALYELSKNQHCQDTLRDEINRVLIKHNGKLSYDAIMEMEYLEQVVNEALRMYPPFPIMPRVCKQKYQVPNTDLVLDKDTFVMVSMMATQMDEEYWHEPKKFDPIRFQKGWKGSKPMAAWMPFGDGPRQCIGMRFGLLQTKIGLITIIKNFRIRLNQKTNPECIFSTPELILTKQGGVWLDLEKI